MGYLSINELSINELSMGKISLILGSHKHLPYGSSADEFEELYRRELKPCVTTLYRFPRISLVLHYSGVLLQWIERRHPELIMLLKNLVVRKQVEFLGGGFYEPLLPLIPLADKLGQIEMMTTYLRKTFGKRPQGCLLPCNAWEQNLTGPLHACGMVYTFLNEALFSHVHGGRAPYYGPCITEDQGKVITVFPVYSELGRTLSVRNPAAALEKLPEETEQEKVFTIFTNKFFDKDINELFYNDFFDSLSVVYSIPI
jgi:alpha-amylase/alpha-mannosidase (GH57 family)